MMSEIQLDVFIDFKSPYAFLSIKPLRAIAIEYDVTLNWLPYNLVIPEFLGSLENRNDHQWRRVKYSYMDARRLANQRNMTILGPQKVFDSTRASIALLFAKTFPETDLFIDLVFERFFKRQLDIEDEHALAAVIEECGGNSNTFLEFSKTQGPQEFKQLVMESELKGVFGVPSFIFENELFWGNERLDLLTERFRAKRLHEADQKRERVV